MTATDVPNVLDVQEPGAVRGLAEVFPQDAYPFPRVEVAQRWLREIEVPDIDCYVVLVDDAVAGFAASRGDEFFHFGIALGHWGTGLAQTAHDAVLDRMQSRGVQRAWLRVSPGTNEADGSTRSSTGTRPVPAPTALFRHTQSSCATNAPSSGMPRAEPRIR